MNLLDMSPLTHCRSEPYGLPVSAFHRIPPVWTAGSVEPDLVHEWDEVVAASNSRIGERDSALKHPKTFVYAFARRSNLVSLMAHGKTRRFLAVLHPSVRTGEWPMPWWIGDQRRMENAYPVFKMNVDRRILAWILENRPLGRFIHIARHPCGRLNSWLNRFAAKRDVRQISTYNNERLRRISEAEPMWREKFGDIGAMTFVESEIWFWRYLNESIDAAGKDYPGYMRIIYEDLAANPIAVAKATYQFCGLPWERRVEAVITRDATSKRATQDASTAIAERWTDELAPEHIGIVHRLVGDSPIMAWWPNYHSADPTETR